MVKAIGPLFSLNAVGTYKDALTFYTKAGQAIISYSNPLAGMYRRTVGKVFQAQQIIFGSGMEDWALLHAFGQAVWKKIAEGKPFLGRCSFMSTYLKEKGVYWANYPFPQLIGLTYYTNTLTNYDQKISNLELLTGLSFFKKPEAYYTEFSIPQAVGQANPTGSFYVLPSSLFEDYPPETQSNVIYHEMTHCLMNQHGYVKTYDNSQQTEEVCDEVAQRMSDQQYTPIYRYSKNNKTLYEIIYG